MTVRTDPTGRTFISYRSTNKLAVERVVKALLERGIPVWFDHRNLPERYIQKEITEVLNDPNIIGSALFWLTEDIKGNAIIIETEIGLSLKRLDREDGFFVLPVAVGIKHDETDKIVAERLKGVELSKLRQIEISDAATDDEVKRIARRALESRIQAIHAVTPLTDPLRLALYTWETPPFENGIALHLDWSDRFTDYRSATPESWNAHLLPALDDIVKVTAKCAPNRAIVAEKMASLSAAFALGATFRQPRDQRLTWNQYTNGKYESWDINVEREESGFKPEIREADASAEDVAVLVSVRNDVFSAFKETKGIGPFRSILHVRQDNLPPRRVLTPGEAADVACKTYEGLFQIRKDRLIKGDIHLFIAGPVGLAVMIGQLLNTFSWVQAYEYDADSSSYRPSVRVNPSK